MGQIGCLSSVAVYFVVKSFQTAVATFEILSAFSVLSVLTAGLLWCLDYYKHRVKQYNEEELTSGEEEDPDHHFLIETTTNSERDYFSSTYFATGAMN